MYRELLADATFHNLLLACDRDLADTAIRRRPALVALMHIKFVHPALV